MQRTTDAGFTLVEMLISMTILGIVMPVLAAMLWNVTTTSAVATAQQDESHDAQLAAGYFARDVSSVGLRDWSLPPVQATYGKFLGTAAVETNVGPTAGVNRCGAGGLPNAAVRIAFNDFTSSPPAARSVVVAYVPEPVGTRFALHRLECRNGSTTPTRDTVVARNLTSAPTVVCSGAGGCGTSPPPATVTMTIAVRAPGQAGPGMSVVLTGKRRQT